MNSNASRRKIIYFALFSWVILSLQSCDKNQPNITQPTQDELQIDRVIKDTYHQWYVKKGDQPDFTNIQNYVTQAATFHEVEKGNQSVKLHSDIVKEFEDSFSQGHIISFDEREIAAETIIIGNIAHRLSYHVYRTNTNDRITQRAVNSIQLVRGRDGWRIQSIMRQLENDDYQLPKKYDAFK